MSSNFSSALKQALLFGLLAALLTFSLTTQHGYEYQKRDYLFVLVVIVTILYQRMTTSKYENLINQEYKRRAQEAFPLEKVEFIQGKSFELKEDVVTCILFFGTWCKASRKALKEFQRLTVSFPKVQFVALTQEFKKELEMYEVKGREASDFQELNEFSFSIGIEDGLLCKEYMLRQDIETIPYVFIVDKSKRIVWHGDPLSKDIYKEIQLTTIQ